MNVVDIAKAHNWGMPTVCPKCGKALVVSDKLTELYCGNPNCKSYIAGRLNKWTNIVNAKLFGKAVIDTFAELGFDSIHQIYENKFYDKLLTLDGYGKRKIEKMRAELESHKKITLAQFLAGFNIEDIGLRVAEKAIAAVGAKTVEDLLMKRSVDFISDGISSITAEKLFNGLAALKDDMRKTASYVEIIGEEKLDKGSHLDGMSFCFTGAMEYKRADLEKMVVDNGGVVSPVNKSLTYLVQQDPNSTSGKSEKAKKLGIRVISPTEFFELLKK